MSDNLKKMSEAVRGGEGENLENFKLFVADDSGLETDTVAKEVTAAIVSHESGVSEVHTDSPEQIESKSYAPLAEAIGVE